MRKIAAVAVLLVGLFALLGLEALAESTRPPTNLKKVGDHWTPWDPPPAGPDAYIIQKGDTLWDLSQSWLGDPYLWPQIWDENRYILDSHWIYPGDPLVVPGRPTVVPEDGPPPVAEAREPEPPAEPPKPVTPPPPPLVPAADTSELYCSGYIEHLNQPPSLWIAGRHLERVSVGEGDVVFLNHGRDHGIRAGDAFSILRRTHHVDHPTDQRDLGTLVRRMGRLRVMLAHETSSTAVIEMSCEDILEGDELVPWEEIPVPMLASVPAFDAHDPTPSGGATGHIVASRDNLSALGAGHVIFTDLGGLSGVSPGDFITLYRERAHDLPRLKLGQAVILTVEGGTSTAKITSSVRESWIGDRVEVWR